ncbi:tetratricopeptide repeat protein [Vibrio splendidus]|nr:hypothetical protein [Vibrio splendidus]MCC4878468.1 hypothetical protein [Vibrio splendidus]
MIDSNTTVVARVHPWNIIDEAFEILNSDNPEKDTEKAIALIHESGVHTVMAEIYIDGIHVKKDVERARVILEYGVKTGCPYSKLFLASFYEHGAGGLEKDHAKSYELISSTIDSVFCGLQLARCFELGIGVKVNKEMSFQILSALDDEILESRGMHAECLALARHYEEGIGTKKDTKAAKFYELLSFKIKG